MEDTQKLTHLFGILGNAGLRHLVDRTIGLAAMEAEEQELLEDFFRGRNWTSDKQMRFNRMREENFLKPEGSRAA
jgi:hypothetical protein